MLLQKRRSNRRTSHPSSLCSFPSLSGYDPNTNFLIPSEAILPRTAGLDIDRLDLVGGQPSLDFLGDKLRTIVTPQVGGRSVLGDGPPDPFEHIAALESTVGPQHMTLTGVFVQDRQHAQGSASRGGIRDEVPAPDMAPVLGLRRQPRGEATTHHLAPGGRHSQP